MNNKKRYLIISKLSGSPGRYDTMEEVLKTVEDSDLDWDVYELKGTYTTPKMSQTIVEYKPTDELYGNQRLYGIHSIKRLHDPIGGTLSSLRALPKFLQTNFP